MEPLKVASVGLGRWGEMLAGKSAEAGFEVVAGFARTPETREAFAGTYGGRPAGSLEELLSDPDVDAVLLATPHSTHPDLVAQFAAAGKHIFVDKPFTLTVAEGRRAIKAAEEAEVVLQVGHNRRRQPANRRLKDRKSVV